MPSCLDVAVKEPFAHPESGGQREEISVSDRLCPTGGHLWRSWICSWARGDLEARLEGFALPGAVHRSTMSANSAVGLRKRSAWTWNSRCCTLRDCDAIRLSHDEIRPEAHQGANRIWRTVRIAVYRSRAEIHPCDGGPRGARRSRAPWPVGRGRLVDAGHRVDRRCGRTTFRPRVVAAGQRI